MTWDKEHWEYQCSDGKHDSIWKTIVSSPQWAAWEMGPAQKRGWDADETRDCNWMSAKHFQAFLRFHKRMKG